MLKVFALKGRGFSRAASILFYNVALATEGMLIQISRPRPPP